jgi:hypothetical protein
MQKAKNSIKESEKKYIQEDITPTVNVSLNGMTSEELSKAADEVMDGITCSLDSPEDCEMCGS